MGSKDHNKTPLNAFATNYEENEIVNNAAEGVKLSGVFTASKDHDINTNEPSSQAYSIKQGRSRRARDARNKAESPLSIRNIINKLEKEQREKRNVPGTAGTLQHKTRFEQASHVQRANL